MNNRKSLLESNLFSLVASDMRDISINNILKQLEYLKLKETNLNVLFLYNYSLN